MYKILIIIFIYPIHLFANCTNFTNAENVLYHINTGDSIEKVYKIMKNAGWKVYSGGRAGLHLSNYFKVTKENGDTILADAPEGKKRIKFKSKNNDDVFIIVIELNKNSNVVEKKFLEKEIITPEKYLKVYGQYPKIEHCSLFKNLKVQNKLFTKKDGVITCNGYTLSKIQDSLKNDKVVTIDSVLNKLKDCYSGNDFFCITALNGWYSVRNENFYWSPIKIADPCGDSISVDVIANEFSFYSKGDTINKIVITTKTLYDETIIANVNTVRIGNEKGDVWQYFNWKK